MKPNAIVLNWDGKFFQIHYDKSGEVVIYEISQKIFEIYKSKINKESKVYSVEVPIFQNEG